MVKRKTDSRLCVGGSHLNEDSNAEHGQICIETVLHCSRPMETAISARKIIFARGLPVGLQSQVDEIFAFISAIFFYLISFFSGVKTVMLDSLIFLLEFT